MTDIFSAINGALNVPLRAIDKVAGYMHDVAFRCEKIETTVDKLTDPKNWPVRAAARRLRAATIGYASGDSPQQKRSPVTTSRAMTMTTLAALLGLSVDQLLALNPQLARAPIVPAGTTIRVPARV